MRFAYETLKTIYFIKIFSSKKSHIFVQIILCLGLGLTSCADNSSSATCTNPTKGKARLVAYRVAKHSHLWFENVETKKIYDISGVGGRREPSISLGSSIPVEYCLGDIHLDRATFVKVPVNRDTRFVALPGYEYLYQ